MKFCSNCATPVISRIPEDDHRHRFVCPSCESIFYHNPKVITGCIVSYNDQILLCRRAIEPRLGLWTIPAGFLENDETSDEGAKRETFEESLAEVQDLELFCLYNIPHISQIYMIYRARMLKSEYSPTPESSEVSLFSEQDIPWHDLAFPVVTAALQHFFKQRNTGKFEIIIDQIDKRKTT
ncbi:MutT/Nudix family protein [hydrothermal vent metagenome]|uniref:MutT/Nudix family protein n=1 Tax=hydrothermal vent metagenome TaxID=652676 RepID=A0A3B0YSR3_9ZZZZ